MSHSKELPPSAASLVLSLRDLGYSLETAVADIVDNSLAAGATSIRVNCDLVSVDPSLTIIDDGKGMDADELLIAMRHGSKGPDATRLPSDLGRFGLGLKTASFSQARRLTVVSRTLTGVVGAEWDLDLVKATDRWIVHILTNEEISCVPFVECLGEHGTLVAWRNLDRLFEDEVGHDREILVNDKLSALREHLSLVFHRFLEGDTPYGKIVMKVNGHVLSPFDPFCKTNKATQKLPKDVVKIDGHRVEMQAFILPHHSRLSEHEYDFYRTRSDFLSNQGAYVYRNCRLMAWGDWFRLVPKGESTKLGRVQIDFPSALDESWTIDIKKSRARPPRIVRDHLRQILEKITGTAVRVHRGRGERLYQETESPIWERFADQGHIRYAINTHHPIVAQLLTQFDVNNKRNFIALLEAISAALPIELLYCDYSSDPKSFANPTTDVEEALQRLRSLKLKLFTEGDFDKEQFLKIVDSTQLFLGSEALVENFANGEIE